VEKRVRFKSFESEQKEKILKLKILKNNEKY
jgi:hypothetical protein